MNNEIQKKKHLELKNIITAYHNVINIGNPNAKMIDIDSLTRESQIGHNLYSKFRLNFNVKSLHEMYNILNLSSYNFCLKYCYFFYVVNI